MQGKVIKSVQITMDENESELFWNALDQALPAFTTDQRRIVQEYINTVAETMAANANVIPVANEFGEPLSQTTGKPIKRSTQRDRSY